MPQTRPQINTGAYGKAGDRANIGGAVQKVLDRSTKDVQSFQDRQQKRELADAKLEAADLAAQSARNTIEGQERTYRKEFTIDPATLALEAAEVQEQFGQQGDRLFSLKRKIQNGDKLSNEEQAEKYMIEGSIGAFKELTAAENAAITAHKEVLNSTGLDNYNDPGDRAAALAVAERKLKKKLVNGQWNYVGEIQVPKDGGGFETVKVDEPAAGFLNNLNLTAKTDWDAANATDKADLKFTEHTETDQITGEKRKIKIYDDADALKRVTAGFTDPDKLDSYAFRYLTTTGKLSDADARAQIEDYQLDGYGDFRNTLIQDRLADIKRDTTRTTLQKAADPKALAEKNALKKGKTTYKKSDEIRWTAQTTKVNDLLSKPITETTIKALTSLAPEKLRITPKENGGLTILLKGRKDDVGLPVEEEFTADQLQAAGDLILEVTGVDAGWLNGVTTPTTYSNADLDALILS